MVEENEKKLLLEAVTENPYNLFYYAQFLVMDYPNEIYELCANYIREQCAQATDRRLYKKVCKDLLQLIKWKGNATAKLLVDEFKATYPRRSALLDELQKVEEIVSVTWLLHYLQYPTESHRNPLCFLVLTTTEKKDSPHNKADLRIALVEIQCSGFCRQCAIAVHKVQEVSTVPTTSSFGTVRMSRAKNTCLLR